MKSLKEALLAGEFAITAEVGPPKGTDAAAFVGKAKLLRSHVNAVNVTDNQGAVMRMSSLAASALLASEGLDVVYQLTCRDRNRLALQSDMLGAHALGIKNILALTGDYITMGDHPQGKAVFDIDSTHLLQIAEKLNSGTDMMGNPLSEATDLFPGAVVTPSANPLEPQLLRFEKKIRAGARFIQSQAIFNKDGLKKTVSLAEKHNVKILAGIILLKSAGMARFLNANIPGVTVPEEMIKKLEKSSNPLERGIEMAAGQIETFRPHCHGVHLMAPGAEEKVIDILNTWRVEKVRGFTVE
ncbi:MAG: methylenetetrahydrofolate reductase [Deltaproteobacteria bacterium]|nr:methylenetetrahydrofolate reductase [Deltaproteobacteria bacterium]